MTSGLLFLGALGTGWMAYEYTEKKALLNWERTHLPSQRILSYAFGSRHMQQLKDPKLLQRALRALPSRWDEGGSIWLSDSGYWVAFYGSPDENLQVQIYCSPCSKPPTQWKSMGMGWRALELVLEELDRRAIPSRAHVGPKAKGPFRDRREIFY